MNSMMAVLMSGMALIFFVLAILSIISVDKNKKLFDDNEERQHSMAIVPLCPKSGFYPIRKNTLKNTCERGF